MLTAVADLDSLCYKAGAQSSWREVTDLLDAVIRTIKSTTGCDAFEGYSESPNGKLVFRHHVAVTRPYKAGRTAPKPAYLIDAKRYLHEQHGVQYTHHVEAEDAVLIRANELGIPNVIICAIDKDLHQSHGVFFDYNKLETFEISPQDAQRNFWRQVVTGDTVDNIPGLPKRGAKFAEQLDELPVGRLPKTVGAWYRADGWPYAYLLEQCRLLYLLRHRQDVFHLPFSSDDYCQLEA